MTRSAPEALELERKHDRPPRRWLQRLGVRLTVPVRPPADTSPGVGSGRDLDLYPGSPNRGAPRATTRLQISVPESPAGTMGNGQNPENTPSDRPEARNHEEKR